MVKSTDLVKVDVLVNGSSNPIMIEKGMSFENNGSIYTINEESKLKKFNKTQNLWQDATVIEMRNYQWKAFQNIANNDGDQNTYTFNDLDIAKDLYKDGEFKFDMSQDLPSGYRIEHPAMYTKENTIQAYVTNGNANQSATLKFSFSDGQHIPSGNSVKVIDAWDLEKHPNKKVGLLENGKIAYGEAVGNDNFNSTRLPYVENGVIALKYSDTIKTCTYKNGKLVKFESKTCREQEDLGYLPATSSKGDHQIAEFYPNGQLKSVDIKYIEYGEFEGAHFKCKYDQNGNYISGTQRIYNPYTDEIEWADMTQEEAEGNMNTYLLF